MMCNPSIKRQSDKIRELSTKIKEAETAVKKAYATVYRANKVIEETIAESIRMHVDLY